jgi:hypothetical protein
MYTARAVLNFSILFSLMIYLSVCCNNSPEGPEGNQPLTVTLVSPSNNTSDLDTSIDFSWIGSDIDDDSLTYDIRLSIGDSVIQSFNGIKTQSMQISDLNYWTSYKWEVTVTDGKNSASQSFYFSTRKKDVTFSTYLGDWKTEGYIDTVAVYELTFELKSDSTFSCSKNRITDNFTEKSYNGTWSVNVTGEFLRFDFQNITGNVRYYFYFSGQHNELMYMQHTEGLDMFDGALGTKWCFRKQ